MMGAVIRTFHPVFIEPVVRQDGDAIDWEQEAHEAYHGPPARAEPRRASFQDLVVRKLQAHLDAWRPAAAEAGE